MSDKNSTGPRSKEVSLGEVLSKLLMDEDLHDVTLKGSDGVEVKANRSVMAARSPVFKAMLLGKFSEATGDEVKIDEYEGSVLRAVVEYVHTDQPQMLNSKKRKAKDANGDGEFYPDQIQALVSLVAAAKYFDLPGLTNEVLEFVSVELKESPSMSFALLEACNQMGPAVPDELASFALTHARSSCNSVNNVNAVACLSQKTLEQILKDDKMRMTEFELFKLLLAWVKSSPLERKPIAKGFTKHIQLEGISPGNLSSSVQPSELVTTEQLVRAYKCHAMATEKPHFVEYRRYSKTFPLWSITPSHHCISANGDIKWGILQHPSISSGVHQWTLELICHEYTSLFFGVVLKSAPLGPHKWLTSQKGAWGFEADGDTYADGHRMAKYDWSLCAGERVTVTLDLRPSNPGNGTLGGWIQMGTNDTIPFKPISNLLAHLVSHPTGFVPAVECQGTDGFRLLDFQKLQD